MPAPNAVDTILTAAHGSHKLAFPSRDSQHADLNALAARFDANIEKDARCYWRRRLYGGRHAGQEALEHYGALIDNIAHDIDARHHTGRPLDTRLAKSILVLENDYNNSPNGPRPLWLTALLWLKGDKRADQPDLTHLPMNVNYRHWQKLLAADPHHLSEQQVNHDPASNIRAALIILSHLDASVDSSIKNPERMAIVASLYGNTEATLAAKKPIAYGGKVAELYNDAGLFPPVRPVSPPHFMPLPTPRSVGNMLGGMHR